MTKLPIGEDETAAKHQQTVDEAKKHGVMRTRAQVTDKAMKLLASMRADLAAGLELFTEEGDPIDLDHALAYALAGKVVLRRKPPKDEPFVVVKGPPIGLKPEKK